MENNEKPRLTTGALLNQAPVKYHTPAHDIKSIEPVGGNYEVAKMLAAKGLYIFPCQSDGDGVKKPWPGYTWRDRSTSDAVRVEQIWRTCHDAAPGIDCGKSKLLVFDPDCKIGGPNGVVAWQILVHKHGDPNAPCVRTPSGGLHVYFRQPEGRPPLGNKTGNLPKGIDVRGDGGYVIAPNTRLDNGGCYGPLEGPSEIPTVPDWLIAYIEGSEIDMAEAALPSTGSLPSAAVDVSRYRDAGIEAELSNVENAPKGERNNTLNRAAFAIGQMVGGGWLQEAEAKELLFNAAKACGLARVEASATIRSGVEAGKKQPRSIPHLRSVENEELATLGNAVAEALLQNQKDAAPPTLKKQNKHLVYTAAQLRDQEFPPIRYICEGLIPEGCTILAGRPKCGKSWAGLDLGLAVASGGEFLGRECVKGDVLYLALEDNPRRIKSRLKRLRCETWPSNLSFAHTAPNGKNAIDLLRDWTKKANFPRLVIVDTLAKVREAAKGRGDGYAEDYKAVATFQEFASETGVAILIVHHTRKAEADDPYDTVSGTLGLTGAADSVLIMQLDRTCGTMMLYGKGRDLQDYEHPVKLDPDTCRWSFSVNFDDIIASETRKKILKLLQNSPVALSRKEIIGQTGLTEAAVKKQLERLIQAGKVVKPDRGKFEMAAVGVDEQTLDVEATEMLETQVAPMASDDA